MREVAVLAAVFLVFFLQGKFSVLGITPDLTAALAFVAGIRYGETKGLAAGAALGALEDVLAGSIIGPNLLGKGVVGFSASFFVSGGPLRWTPLLGTIAIFLLTCLDNLIVYFSRGMFDRVPSLPAMALLVAVLQAVLNSPVGFFVRPRNVD